MAIGTNNHTSDANWPFCIVRIKHAGKQWTFDIRLCERRLESRLVGQRFDTLQEAVDNAYKMMDGDKRKAIVDARFKYRGRRIVLRHSANKWRYDVELNESNHFGPSHQGWDSIEEAYIAALEREDSLLEADRPARRTRRLRLVSIFSLLACVVAVAYFYPVAVLWVGLWCVAGVGTLGIIVSVIAFMYWAFHFEQWRDFRERHGFWYGTIGWTAFVGCAFMLAIAFKHSAWFIPANWGSYDEHAEWLSTRDYFAYLIGPGMSCFLVCLFGLLYDRYEKQHGMEREVNQMRGDASRFEAIVCFCHEVYIEDIRPQIEEWVEERSDRLDWGNVPTLLFEEPLTIDDWLERWRTDNGNSDEKEPDVFEEPYDHFLCKYLGGFLKIRAAVAELRTLFDLEPDEEDEDVDIKLSVRSSFAFRDPARTLRVYLALLERGELDDMPDECELEAAEEQEIKRERANLQEFDNDLDRISEQLDTAIQEDKAKRKEFLAFLEREIDEEFKVATVQKQAFTRSLSTASDEALQSLKKDYEKEISEFSECETELGDLDDDELDNLSDKLREALFGLRSVEAEEARRAESPPKSDTKEDRS